MTYVPAKFKITMSNGLGEDAFARKELTFDLQTKDISNVVQYSLNHVTLAPAKFEVAVSKGLGGGAFKVDTSNGLGDAFTRK